MKRKKETPDFVKRHITERVFTEFSDGKAQQKLMPVSEVTGLAQSSWYAWNTDQRRMILSQWCNLTPPAVRLNLDKPWFQLSLYVRQSIKRFFRTNSVFGSLRDLRHPEEVK